MPEPIRYGGIVAGVNEIDAVVEVLKGQGWGCGPITAEFETEAARVQGRRHALFVNSGSSALLLALATLPRGTRVAMPALQFPTLYAAAVRLGHYPVLLDCDDSLNMDPAELQAELAPAIHTTYPRAVAFVHVAGNPTNIAEVADLCQAARVPLIEDNCEGFGGTVSTNPAPGTYEHRRVGNWGDISCTSTHAAHTISTGEGGLVFCDDEATHERMRCLRDWGWDRERARETGYHYSYTELGFNLHATDIQAALGLVQIKRLAEFASLRREHCALIRRGLAGLPVALPRVDPAAYPSWFCCPLLVDDRDGLRAHLAKEEIETRPILVGNLLRQPLGIEGPPCPKADDVYRRGLWLSVHPRLTAVQRERMVAAVRAFFE